MTSYLIDVNVWIALTWGMHVHHQAAAQWEQSLSGGSLLFCRFTMLSFLRLLTTKQLMAASTMTVADALNLYDVWFEDPRVLFQPEPRGIDRSLRRILEYVGPKAAPKTIADCYFAAFAESVGAYLVTFDAALAKLAKQCGSKVVLLSAE